MGDLNIDLTKYDTHLSSSEFRAYVYSQYDPINSYTYHNYCIDGIIDRSHFTNNFNDAFQHDHIYCILCATIIDHYGVSHISGGNIKISHEN